MPVFAMTREMGTRGKDIAASLAERLDLDVVHHELIERHVAERMQIGESSVHRFLEGQPSLMERWKIDRKRLSHYTSEEVIEIAMKGNVIIRGWGAAQLLGDVGHVITVRVCAPMKARAAEMMRRVGFDDEPSAVREIERNDAAHDRLVRARFAQDWRDPLSYDVVFNTARLPIETCVAQLQNLVEGGLYRETDASRDLLADKLLSARAQRLLDQDARGAVLELEARARGGVVTISGVTYRDTNIRSIAARVRDIDGVRDVQTDIRVLKNSQGV